MPLPKTDPTRSESWKRLKDHFREIQTTHLKSLFSDDPGRAARFTIEWEGFLLDYSKNRITGKTMELLHGLGAECGGNHRGL